MTVIVVTPVYSSPERPRLSLLKQTLESVSRQSLSHVHLIVDDGSSDDVRSYVRDHRDDRCRYVRRERSPMDLGTASNALNVGLELVLYGHQDIFTTKERQTLDAVTYLHSDDMLAPDSLSSRHHALGDSFVYTDMVMFEQQRAPLLRKGTEYVRPKNVLYGEFNHHTTMWQASFLKQLKAYVEQKYDQDGLFDNRLFFGEDLDVTLSSIRYAQSLHCNATYLPRVTVLYRLHHDSITGGTKNAAKKQQMLLIAQKHPGWYDAKIRSRLCQDLPWSLFTHLPERVKRRLRPVRQLVRNGMQYEHQAITDDVRSMIAHS